jgi:ATP-dependent RNA helicase DDX56/DBP9
MTITYMYLQSLHLRDSLEILVVDEADLVFSYGYEDDVKIVLR